MNVLSFPGLGIGEFTINKVAFTIFGRDIAWYGIIIAVGILLAFLYVMNKAKYEKIKEDYVYDLLFACVILAVICARAYYVIFDPHPENYKTFYDVIAIWEGGIAIYGAIIGGAVAAWLVCKYRKLKTMQVFDMLSPAVLIGQILGRWGNFFNAEAHGGETDIFCRMGIKYGGVGEAIYVHPTFLYESLWNLVGFILINAFYKKKKYNGQVFYMYIAWYGFGRMLVEGLRTDSLWLGGIRISQLVGGVCFIVGAALLIYNGIKNKKKSEVVEDGEDNQR